VEELAHCGTTSDCAHSIKIDEPGESSGIRTQFLRRMVDFWDEIGIPIQPSIIRLIIVNIIPLSGAGEFLEQHWNGTLLRDIQTLLAWARV
jgi:hypothetical protein